MPAQSGLQSGEQVQALLAQGGQVTANAAEGNLCWLRARSVRQIRPLRTPFHNSCILLIPLKESRIEIHSPAHLQKG